MAYTDAQIDALIAALQKQINLKAPSADLSVQAGQNNTRIQGNINDIGDLQTSMTNLQKSSASLNQRLLDTQTYSVSVPVINPDTGVSTTIPMFQPFAAMTIVEVSAIRTSGTSSSVQVLNGTGEVLSDAMSTVSGSWSSNTGISNAGVTATGNVQMVLSAVTGAQTVVVQVDFTVD